jgi:WD40 repeat protein
VASGKELLSMRRHTSAIGTVAFSPDGRLGISGSQDSTFRVWDLKAEKELRCFQGHGSAVFLPDSHHILSWGGNDRALRLWDVDTGARLWCSLDHTGGVEAVGLSRDGRYVLCGSGDGTVRLWRLLKLDQAPARRAADRTEPTKRKTAVRFQPR